MAQVEPMDIDDNDFDNKENTYHHSNVLSRTPCTEKGYEELDVSELNMKLRYSFSPASSPMSKSLTSCLDNRNCNQGEDYHNAVVIDNGNLTRSLNSTLNKTETITKSKVLPLQTLSAVVDSNRNSSMRRLIDQPDANVTISVSTNDIDDNLSLPSTSSSVAQTPEATTPTKDIPKPEGSPILRGLKSVLSMFRPSQSPIPPADDKIPQQDVLSPIEHLPTSSVKESEMQSVKASTPVAETKKDNSRRSSPLKESIVFNDDLERELQWKDDSTIIFKDEKIPIHKLFFQNPLTPEKSKKTVAEQLNTTVEYMDTSCNESFAADKSLVYIEKDQDRNKNEIVVAVESDNEFLDCETTFTRNDSDNENIELKNETQIGNVTVDLLGNVADVCKEVMDNSSVVVNDLTARIEGENKTTVEVTTDVLKSEHEDKLNTTKCIDLSLAVNNLTATIESEFNTTLENLAARIEGDINSSVDVSKTECKEILNITQTMEPFTANDVITNIEVATEKLSNECIEILNTTKCIDQASSVIDVAASGIEATTDVLKSECKEIVRDTTDMDPTPINNVTAATDTSTSIEVATDVLESEYKEIINTIQPASTVSDFITTQGKSTESVEITTDVLKNECNEMAKTTNCMDPSLTLSTPVITKDIKSEIVELTKEFLNRENYYNESSNLPLLPAANVSLEHELEECNTQIDALQITKMQDNVDYEGVVISKIEKLPDVCIPICNSTENYQDGLCAPSHIKKIDENVIPMSNCSEVKNIKEENINIACEISKTVEAVMPTLPNALEQNVPNDLDNSILKSPLNSNIYESFKGSNEIELGVNINDIIIDHKMVEEESIMSILKETESKQDITKTNVIISGHDDIKNLDFNSERVLQIVNMSKTVESELNSIQTLKMLCDLAGDNSLSMDNDREMPELTVENNIAIEKPPSEIPLPDDDDMEDTIQETNHGIDLNKAQNVTFAMSNANSTIVIEDTKMSSAEPRNLNCLNITQNFEENKISQSQSFNEQVEVTHNNETYNFITESLNGISLNKSEGLEDGKNKICSENISLETNSERTLQNMQINTEIMVQPNLLPTQEVISENVNDIHTQSAQKHFENISESSENKNLRDSITNTEDILKPSEFDTKKVEQKATTQPEENVTDIINPSTASTFNTQIDIVGDMTNIVADTISIEKCHIEKIEELTKLDDVEKEVVEIDEEIITSANNSPYVSVTDLAIDVEEKIKDTTEEIDNPFTTKSKIAPSPPISPKIVSKGYNFNFDEIDDPFATKTKIRMSPTPDSPNQSSATFVEEIKTLEEVPKKPVNNRRKSQPDRKKPAPKKNFNSTFSGQTSNKNKKSIQKNNVATDKVSDVDISSEISKMPQPKPTKPKMDITKDISGVDTDMNNEEKTVTPTLSSSPLSIQKEEIPPQFEVMKSVEQTHVVLDQNSTSSEQYFSLGTSSCESVGHMTSSKNVFNIPEIDDVNFNPFVTKSKMRMSPPPVSNSHQFEDLSVKDTSLSQPTADNTVSAPENMYIADVTITETETKDSSPNISNITCSSKNTTEKDVTVREILTEDEDTMEGPFLEVEDIKDAEKLSDLEVDMMNFDEEPPQDRDENLENGEMFIDADAFEFLLNQNKSSTVLDSGKESLFLKFDPLFAKRESSEGVLAVLSKIQKRQSTPKKTPRAQKDLLTAESPEAGPSNAGESNPLEDYNEDLTSNITKPMMAVSPAVSSISPRKAAATPKINRRSLTFTSPAMAVIDRLLSLSGNSSHLNHDTSIPYMGREHNETDLAITQLRELLAEKEIHVHNLRCESKELKERLAALEVQVRGLETINTERLTKINELNERLSEKSKINRSMATVVEEYERTIASLIAEKEQDKKRNAEERIKLIKERDEQVAHLTSMEVSFNDVHTKYEKSKQIILSCKANEDAYKKSIKEFEENFSKMQNNYELLKQHATSKLNHANQELEKMNKAHEAEILKLTAMIKRKDLHITSLEETLAQKSKANEELTAICDELINKVG